ncbi:DUF3772 domain-containing protein [Achromobacter aloeverae]
MNSSIVSSSRGQAAADPAAARPARDAGQARAAADLAAAAGGAAHEARPRRPALIAAVWLCLSLCFGLLLIGIAAPVHAQGAAAPAEAEKSPEKALDAARKQMDALRKGLAEETDDAELLRRRAAALDIQAKADAIADRLAPALAAMQARLTELGPIPDGTKEAHDVAAQRAELEKSRTALDAQVKLARLLSVEGAQTAAQVADVRRAQFQARLGERRASVLGTPFWSEFRGDGPRDITRLGELTDELRTALAGLPGWAWIALAAALAIVIGLWTLISRALIRLTASRVPAGRLRRSVHALTIVLLATITPGLIAELAFIALDWSGELADDTRALLAGTAGIVCFGGFVAGLGIALLEPSRPSWRLLNIPDEIARRMRWFPLTLGPVVTLIWVFERLPGVISASLSTTILANCIAALVLGGVVALGLTRLERARRSALRDPETGRVPPRSLLYVVVVSAIWLALTGSLVALLVGYVAFGNFVVKQLIWSIIVVAATYLLSLLADDFFMAVLGSRRDHGDKDKDKDQDRHTPRLRDQAAVLLSGIVRLFIAIVAITLVLSQFGEGPTELLQRVDQWRNGLAIGEVQLRPAALMQGLLVLGVGLFAVRMLKRWLTARFLPTTTLDTGMQTSTTTLFGYVGIVIAIALSLSALGIGLERVAWVASALSVGIGFGLQAVVQNFVSGLILLAERPVKVGDWVSLGGVEGDIRRINVRATEIQMSDRSTVIVPNSEFITKTVRNVTHANPLGLVQIKLPMPLSANAATIKETILAAFAEHPDVLETPAPNVYLDAIDAGNLQFNATAYVSSPRQAYGTRSTLLFDILKRLAQNGITLGKPPTMLVSAPVAASMPVLAPLAPQAPATVAAPPPAADDEG